MKFAKSHRGAVLITILIVALSIFLGAYRSITAEREKVLVLFEQGVRGDGKSVSGDMQARIATAKNLSTVAGRYLDQAELGELAGAIHWAEGNAHPDKGAFLSADENLGQICEGVITALRQRELSAQDADYIQGFAVELIASRDRMRRDEYNAAAEAFNRQVLGGFPGALLNGMRMVHPLTAVDEGGI